MAPKYTGPQCCIYRITSPSDKFYIGQTRQFIKRMNEHKNLQGEKDGNCVRLQAAVRKYGWATMRVEIIHDCTDFDQDATNQLEIDEIANHDSTSEKGYNCTSGGDGGYTRIPETVERVRQAMLRHHRDGPGHTDKAKERISDSLREYKEEHGVSEDHRTKLSKALKGRVFSSEWREKISNANRGRVQSKDTIQKRMTTAALTRKRKIDTNNGQPLSQVQRCGICKERGHKRNYCPTVDRPVKSNAERAALIGTRRRTCVLCAEQGHSASVCGMNPNGKGPTWASRRTAFMKE